MGEGEGGLFCILSFTLILVYEFHETFPAYTNQQHVRGGICQFVTHFDILEQNQLNSLII